MKREDIDKYYSEHKHNTRFNATFYMFAVIAVVLGLTLALTITSTIQSNSILDSIFGSSKIEPTVNPVDIDNSTNQTNIIIPNLFYEALWKYCSNNAINFEECKNFGLLSEDTKFEEVYSKVYETKKEISQSFTNWWFGQIKVGLDSANIGNIGPGSIDGYGGFGGITCSITQAAPWSCTARSYYVSLNGQIINVGSCSRTCWDPIHQNGSPAFCDCDEMSGYCSCDCE